MRKLFPSLTAVLFLLSVPLSARPGQVPMFETYDVNNDGVISEQEFNETRAMRIQTRAAEGRALRNMSNMPAFEDVDLDGNGAIDRDEFFKHRQLNRKMRQQNFR